MDEYREYTTETVSAETADGSAVSAKKTKKKTGRGRWIALALCCAILGGIAGAGGGYLAGRGGSGGAGAAAVPTSIYIGQRETQPVEVAYVGTGEPMTAADLYAINVGSTVGITTSITTNFWGVQAVSAASGSGFIITEDGYILTNYHVIEGSDTITVTMYDGASYDAELVGYDESNDIAILKVEAEGLSPVVIGDSDTLRVGDDVIAIGNPLGELTFSLTAGVVSALDREISLSGGLTMNLIQTDCAINSGNSGGALFNMYGEVIGITNAKYSGSGSMGGASIDNIGFAIPINTVMNIVESIIEKGYIAKPYIGVSVTSVGEDSQQLGLPAGAAVKAVTEDSPAADAGLQVNDIITAVDDTEIADSNDLVAVIRAAAVGEKRTLTVYRQGEVLELEIEIGEQVQSALAEEEKAESEEEQPAFDQEQQMQQSIEDFMRGFGGFNFQ